MTGQMSKRAFAIVSTIPDHRHMYSQHSLLFSTTANASTLLLNCKRGIFEAPAGTVRRRCSRQDWKRNSTEDPHCAWKRRLSTLNELYRLSQCNALKAGFRSLELRRLTSRRALAAIAENTL